MTRLSYDQIQAAAPLLTCIRCGAQYFVTRPRDPFICVDCAVKTADADTLEGQRK